MNTGDRNYLLSRQKFPEGCLNPYEAGLGAQGPKNYPNSYTDPHNAEAEGTHSHSGRSLSRLIRMCMLNWTVKLTLVFVYVVITMGSRGPHSDFSPSNHLVKMIFYDLLRIIYFEF